MGKAEQASIAELIDEAYEQEDEELAEGLEAQATAIEERIEEIAARLESYIDFDPEQMKLAGCFVSAGYGGKLSVEKGLVKPGGRKAVAQAQSDEGETEGAQDEKPTLPTTLLSDLKAYRTQVAQVAVAENPAIAFDLLVSGVASDLLSLGSFTKDGPDVSFRQSFPHSSLKDETPACKRLEAIKAGLPLEWLRLDVRFAAFQRLAGGQKLVLLAYCTALTLKPKLAGDESYPTAFEVALSQTGASVAESWRPTAANFLSRIKSSQLLSIGQGIFGGDFTARWAKAKKAELVAMLDWGFSGRDDDRPHVRERLASWLPEGMAFEVGGATGGAEAA